MLADRKPFNSIVFGVSHWKGNEILSIRKVAATLQDRFGIVEIRENRTVFLQRRFYIWVCHLM